MRSVVIIIIYSFFIEGYTASVTSTAFQAGPHCIHVIATKYITIHNIYKIFTKYHTVFTMYLQYITNKYNGIINYKIIINTMIQNTEVQ